jgi:endonuclease YncB( thermonuclease family)
MRGATALLALLAATAQASAGEVRIIGGPGITPPPRFEAPPQRIELPSKPKPPPGAPVDRRMAPVVVESAEELRAGNIRLHLPGVAALPLDETCTDASGARWACGRRALLALRLLVRMKTVVCPIPPEARTGTFEGACRFLAGGDVAERFVASGWARAGDDGRFAEAEKQAREAGLGIWGAAPPPAATAVYEWQGGVPPDPTSAPLGDGVGRPGLDETTTPAAPSRGTTGVE